MKAPHASNEILASPNAPIFPDQEIPPDIVYDARRHAYQRTREYLFAQLIPYIGSKRKLLPLIYRAIGLTGAKPGAGFVDLFAGSGVVSRLAKQLGFRTIANDWEPYAAAINGAAVALNAPPIPNSFFDKLNDLPPVKGFITQNFCPASDSAPNPDTERCYYTRVNGMRIDAIRDKIAEWEESGRISLHAKNYLLAPLIASASYVSNTSGVFKAYHAGWGGATGTALYRILSDLHLKPPVLRDSPSECLTTAMDAVTLAKNWGEMGLGDCEIAYIDPPYNQHPYGSNYHILNTIALWDNPAIPPISDAKSAIRTDWRTLRRSEYNVASKALPALLELIDTLPCRWTILSYSTDGNMPVPSLFRALGARGKVACFARSYKRYRVSAQRMSKQARNVEFAVVLDRYTAPDQIAAEQCLDLIQSISAGQK